MGSFCLSPDSEIWYNRDVQSMELFYIKGRCSIYENGDQLLKAMNDQANMEFASAYLYLGMCYNMEEANLKGTAHWLRI